MPEDLTDDERLVLQSYRMVRAERFGELSVKIHDGKMTRREVTFVQDVPKAIREVGA